jgi:CRP-like cAMP-binding protein/membrane protease YdiL (CAAX protease family)
MINDFEILKQNKLFASLSNRELALCYSTMTEKTYAKDQYIIRQGDEGHELFFIVEGSVEILQKKQDTVHEHSIAVLTKNEIIGELSLVDKKRRASSVRALEPTRVLSLSADNFNQLINDFELHAKLYRNLSQNLSSRLRQTNEVTVKSLENELERQHAQLMAGSFMVKLLILLTLFTFLLSFMTSFAKLHDTAWITIPWLVVIFVIFILEMKRSGYPASFYGFTLINWRRSVTEAVIFTLPVLALIIAAKWLLINTVPAFSQSPLFSLDNFVVSGNLSKEHSITLMALGYIFISAPIQEILFRGGLQGTLQFFLLQKHRYLMAIVTSNLIFAMIHLVLSPVFSLVVFPIGLFWGWLYKRHATLCGVILSHMMIGTWAFLIVGIQSVLLW